MTGWVMSEHGVSNSLLTVIKREEDRFTSDGTRIIRWLVECSCDKHTRFIVDGSSIRSGNTLSCGCIRGYNKKIFHDDYVVIISSNSDDEIYVSKNQIDKVGKYTWRVQVDKRNGYKRVITSVHLENGKCKIVPIWKMITGYDYCDHKNGNTMDNRDENLRQATHDTNMQNKKIYKNNKSGCHGVRQNNRFKWEARIRKNNKEHYLGVYENKDDAILARIKAEFVLFDPEFAPNRGLFSQYNLDLTKERKHWEEWVRQDKVNYLGYPIYNKKAKISKPSASGVLGVQIYKRSNKWKVVQPPDDQRKTLGYFTNKEDAIKSRLQAELEYYGAENAPQRHLFEQYGIEYNPEDKIKGGESNE